MSDNYRALTRTYRPTSFDDIVSQKHVSDTLKNAIKKNRLAHAYMFCGPRGVGKTTMARVLARTVNEVDQQVDGESLNQTLNIIEIDAASNNKVDDIRDLRERVRIPPQNGRYKIYIIDEVHMLSKSAFNALLKTLEEPPDHVIFIFATTEPHKVLPTILSRVQRFDFKRISIEEIVERLSDVAQDEGIRIDKESLHVIAKKADGALRDALGLMDQAIAFCGTDIEHEELLRALNVVSTDRMFEFMDAVEQHDASRGLELINDLLQEGYDIQEYLVGLTEHLRNLYVATTSEKMHLVEASPHLKQRYREAAGTFSGDDLMRMLHIVSEAQFKIKDAHQPKIQFEITLLKLINMERSRELNTLIKELRDLKKNFSNNDIVADAVADADDASPSEDFSPSEASGQPDLSGTENNSATENPASVGDTPHDTSASDAVSPSAREESTSYENGPQEKQAPQEQQAQQDVDIDQPAPQKEPESGSAEPADQDVPEQPAQSPAFQDDPGSANQQASPQQDVAQQELTQEDTPQQERSLSNGRQQENPASQQTTQQASPEPAKDSSPEQDTVTSLFGQSSLEASPASNSNGSGEQQPQDEAPENETPTAPKRAPKDVSLQEVQDQWKEYTMSLRQQVPEMLYFQMQRVDPVKLDKGDLLLRCNDDFAKKIVEENKRRLGKILQQELGAYLNFKCTVHKEKSQAEESMSPYERFKQLQERDPTIKTLIELFGAELDYNLNQ